MKTLLKLTATTIMSSLLLATTASSTPETCITDIQDAKSALVLVDGQKLESHVCTGNLVHFVVTGDNGIDVMYQYDVKAGVISPNPLDSFVDQREVVPQSQ